MLFFVFWVSFVIKRQERPISCTFTGFGSFVLPTPLSSNVSFCCLLLFFLLISFAFSSFFLPFQTFIFFLPFLFASIFLSSFFLCFNLSFFFCFLLSSFLVCELLSFQITSLRERKHPPITAIQGFAPKCLENKENRQTCLFFLGKTDYNVYFPRKNRTHRKQHIRGDPKIPIKLGRKCLGTFFEGAANNLVYRLPC